MTYDHPTLSRIFEQLSQHPITGLPKKLPVGVDGMNQERFRLNLDLYINEIVRKINAKGSPQYRFGPLLRLEKFKEDGGVRLIHIPRLRDQIVLRAMHGHLVCSAADSGVSLKTRSPLQVLIEFRKILSQHSNPVIIRTDISRFYDSVPRFKVIEEAASFFSNSVTEKLMRTWSEQVVSRPLFATGKTADYPVDGLPQGLSISASLSELWAHKLDAMLSADFSFFRYVDDIAVICKDMESANNAIQYLDRCLHELNLKRSIPKTQIAPLNEGISWLGLTHYVDRIIVDDSKIFRWLKKFARIKKNASIRLKNGENASLVLSDYLKTINLELYGKTSSKVSWFAITEDSGQWTEIDRSLHNMVRSVCRQANLPLPGHLPSVKKAIEERRKKISILY